MSSFRLLRMGAMVIALVAVPAIARAESLREALASAYTNNPAIMSALLSVKASAENIALAKSGKLPTISASAGTSVSISTQNPTPTPGAFTLGLTYNQVLFDNFKTDAGIEQARALTEVATYAFQNAEQNVLLSVVSAYMGVIRDTQLVQLTADNLKFFQAQLDSANDRLRIGEGTKIDVSQAQTRLAQSTAAYKTAISNLQTSQASYQRWVGHKPQNLSASFKFGKLIPKSIDQAMNEAEVSHPAIKSAKAAIRAAQAGSDAAEAAFGPTLDLIGSLCAVQCFNTTTVTGVSGSLRMSLSIPLYSGGRLGASMRQANLQQVKSEVDALSARDQIRESVISAWSTLQTATAQIESAQSAVESGDLVLEGMIQQRDVGQATTLDVLNSQAELTSTKQTQISATSSKMIATFALIAATGHLNASDLGLDVTIKSGAGYEAKVEDVWAELRALE